MRTITHQDKQSINQRVARVQKLVESEDGSGKPKRQPFKAITQEERRKRLQLVENGARWGMCIEQISEYARSQGSNISNRKVYDYLDQVKKPRRYNSARSAQHQHTWMTFNCFLRIANDLPTIGRQAEVINFNKSLGEGARCQYDFKFRTGKYLFYGEVQLSDISGTDWRKKHKNYVRWYENNKFPFRTLWIIDQKRDLSLVRAHARRVLEHRPNLSLFLYATLNDLNSGANIARDRIWRTIEGEHVKLFPLVGSQAEPYTTRVTH